ncbi:TetR/AcrR family transcriptional regulator [Paenibacillus senegalensis]|uniref:TetR/AcrR family transcriptional regulator n=1 Tax=Paenibacillus senegalensis TaxID=1465766 RepID=UPI00047477B2|nr:TetR/AcrR family transcriptional regulator [Paenibacillus senegalensis]
MAGSIDRRKKYTQMVVKDSFMQLLKEKPMSSITVKEICERADVNRSTFYAHYYNQYDLLSRIEDETIEDMKGYLNQFDYGNQVDGLRLIENLLEYFAAKRDICQTLLNEKAESTFQGKATVVAHQYFMKNWTAIGHLDKDLSEYVSTFIINGSIHVVKSWLSNNMDKTPKEMAEMLIQLIDKGLFGH